ncbi:MAG: site-specific integrase, partial [Bacteriovoracaceae bacterium]
MEKLDLLKEQQRFLKELELKGKSFNTLKNYRTDLNIFNQFLASKNRPLFLKEISAEQVKDYSRFLEQKYNSPNSIRRRIQALRIFFDWLMEKGLYGDNPIKKALVSPKVVDPPRPLPFKVAYALF